MSVPNPRSLLIAILLCAGAVPGQSLSEAARREAERRRLLEEKGVTAKVISEIPASAAAASVTTSAPAYSRTPSTAGSGKATAPALKSCRSTIERLDRQIREARDRLELLRGRLDAARKEDSELWRPSRTAASRGKAQQVREQVADAETRLSRLREDRLAAWDRCRRAGFLPGEIEGRAEPGPR